MFQLGVDSAHPLYLVAVEQDVEVWLEFASRRVQYCLKQHRVTLPQPYQQGVDCVVLVDRQSDGVCAGLLTEIAIES